MDFESILTVCEIWAGRLGASLGIGTLAMAIWGMVHATRQPAAREAGPGIRYLRWPVLLAATVLFLGAGAAMWRPLPLQLSRKHRHSGDAQHRAEAIGNEGAGR